MPLPYGMDDQKMLSIVNATSGAVDQMRLLNTRVQQQAEDYIRANNSDSGRIVQDGLLRWNGEFNQIVADLDALNQKVTLLRTQNNDALSHSIDTAKNTPL